MLPMIELLEHRAFLSGTASYADCLAPVNAGQWWNYTASYSGDMGSGTAEQAVRVGEKAKKIMGVKCLEMTTVMGDGKSTAAYYLTDDGLYQTLSGQIGGGMSIDMKISKIFIAPDTLALGETFISSAPFSGNFKLSANGITASGKVTGDAESSVTYNGTETVTVPAGTFDAECFTSSLTMSGDMFLRAFGQRAYATYVSEAVCTVHGISGLGLVRVSTTIDVTVSLPDYGEEMSASMTVTARLTSAGWRNIQLVGPNPTISPGDVLLYKGSNIIAKSIIGVEKKQLGKTAAYSHAAIYVGNGQVCEMLANGWRQSWIGDSIGKTKVDAFRHYDIGSQGSQVADAAKNFADTDYAYSQIVVLAMLAKTPIVSTILDLGGKDVVFVDAYLNSEIGDAKMICSELVMRSYAAAGVEIGVTAWPDMINYATWPQDQRFDFTTPNMLFFSSDFYKVSTLN